MNRVDRLAKFIGDKISYFFLAVVALTAYEVMMRYVFNSPTFWVHEASIALCAVAFVFGGPYVLQERGHITIAAIYERLPQRVRRPLDGINLAIVVLYLIALGYGAAIQAGKSIAVMEDTGTASHLPTPPVVKTFLVLGVALMVLQALAHLAAHLRRRS